MKVQQSTTSENQGYEESSKDNKLTFCVAFLSVLCVALAFVVGYLAYDATEEHTCAHDLSKLDGVYITNPYVDMAWTFYYRDQDLYCKRIHPSGTTLTADTVLTESHITEIEANGIVVTDFPVAVRKLEKDVKGDVSMLQFSAEGYSSALDGNAFYGKIEIDLEAMEMRMFDGTFRMQYTNATWFNGTHGRDMYIDQTNEDFVAAIDANQAYQNSEGLPVPFAYILWRQNRTHFTWRQLYIPS